MTSLIIINLTLVDSTIYCYDNKKFINKWEKQHKKLQNLKPTDRKFEWQMGNNYKSIYEGIIQFRPSGVRVKKPDFFPALVAIVHIPIVGKYLRKLTNQIFAVLCNKLNF